MPKKSFFRSLAKKFSLELVEGNIIKIAGIVLTIIIAAQIVITKGAHFVHDLKSDVLGAHESAEAEEIIEPDVAESEGEIENIYETMIENSRTIVLKWNSDGVITYMNPFGAEFFGYSQDEITGKSIFLLIPGVESESNRDLNQMLREIQNDPATHENTANEGIKKSGERTWINWTNSEIENADGAEILSIGRPGEREN